VDRYAGRAAAAGITGGRAEGDESLT
jgi:hypothetical protein